MYDFELSNDYISIGINKHGAELRSIVRKADGREYMWNGDGAYWNRVSPVLFPFVGKLANQSYRYKGHEFSGVPQHGYARDSEFTMVEKNDDTIWFSMDTDDKWKERYPFDFELCLGYRLEGKRVHVLWKVINKDNCNLPFSIGAHPAFWTGIDSKEFVNADRDYKVGCQIDLHTDKKEIKCGVINENGVLGDSVKTLKLTDGKLIVDENLFDDDALIMESGDLNAVSLKDRDGKEFLKVSFDAPMLGIWSPVGKKAPFICIEPWYGRCDRASFTGTLEEREYGNILKPGEEFNAGYVIEIL